MNKRHKIKIIDISIFMFFFILLEFIMYQNMFDKLLPTYFFLDILFAFGLSLIVLLVKNLTFDKVYLGILMFISCAFVTANVNYYNYFGDIFSLQNFTLIGNGLGMALDPSFYDFPFIACMLIYYLIYILVTLVASRISSLNCNIDDFSESKKNRRVRLLSTLLFFIFTATSYGTSIALLSQDSDNLLLAKVSNFKKYGMYGYYSRELVELLGNPNGISEVDKLKNYFTTYEDYSNDFTGSLKGYNVVTIMIETGDDLIMNDAITPNLQELLNDSINFTGNVSKNKTIISEFIGLTGSAPIRGLNDKNNYNLPYSVPRMLGDDYRKVFFHDAVTEGERVRDFYNRKELIPKLGFDEQYFHEQMLSDLPPWDWDGSYTLDSITARRVTDLMLQDLSKPLYAFYTTLSMHGPYTETANRSKLRSMYGKAYDEALAKDPSINPLKDTVNERAVENFLLAAMDFDDGLGYMIDEFKKKGIYDNTIFVIYGDHECYYPGADNVPLNRTLAGYDTINNYDMYKTVLTIANPKLKDMFTKKYGSNEYSKFTSPYNIAPTILDLLGIKYNPRFYMGNSVFSPKMKEPQVFYSIELSAYFNDDYWTIDGETLDNTFNSLADEKAFYKAVKKVIERETYLNKILVNDFFDNNDFSDYQPDYKSGFMNA